ncbi:DNA phosphorothioation-dependent restriction protein DptG [Gottfriedia acidiceleris]|uniref:DNA phosphorothioation-dependent restriction protein DptG n=1 Tax=Gottfriedia acidiceleris TaxID=371036 RepID=UPI003D20279E
MDFNQNAIQLRNYLGVKPEKKGLTHNINKFAPFFPFPTRNPERAKFARGFEGVVGEFSRLLSNQSINDKLDLDEVVNKISEKVEINSEDKPYFKSLIKHYLLDQNSSMKIFHPYIFKYLQKTDGDEGKGESEIALFLRDIYSRENEKIKALFEKTESEHVMAKLILENLDYLEDKEKISKYTGKLEHISNVFYEDFLFITKHTEYFTEHFELFLAYYYFFYITQLSLKLSQRQNANYSEVNELFYTLDWEGTNKSRSSQIKGYNLIKESAKNLLVHSNTLEQINIIQGTKGLSYPELINNFESLSISDKTELENEITNWIKEYADLMEIELVENYSIEYVSLIFKLFAMIEEVHTKIQTKQGTKSRYSLSVEQIGKKYFLKSRGSFGYMLNMSQDLLLLLSAVVIKDHKKSLKDVFKGLEDRGVYFDRYSKEAIVELFDKLNLLDKKSDSGDAQYVKPIL